jgi:hypothetical protein
VNAETLDEIESEDTASKDIMDGLGRMMAPVEEDFKKRIQRYLGTEWNGEDESAPMTTCKG